MQKIKNIIFDYGNVIFMLDFQKTQEAFNQLGIGEEQQIFAHSGQIKLFDDFDKGIIRPEEFRNGIRELAKNATLEDQQIDEAWNALLLGVPSGKHELLLQLKDRYRTFLLSNNNAIHYQRCMESIQEQYDVADNSVFFEHTYYSHLMGMRKPNKDIFEHVLAEQNLIPAETLFIDDSPQHLRTADELGIHTALCSSAHPLEDIIKEWELL